MWADGEMNVTYMEGHQEIKCASINSAIRILTGEQLVDNGDNDVFLLFLCEYPLRGEVLKKIIDRYNVPPMKLPKQVADIIKIRVINLLYEWLSKYFTPRSPDELSSIQLFIATLPKPHEHLLRTALEEKKRAKFTEKLRISKRVDTDVIFLWDISPKEFAMQLTLYDFKYYSAMKPEEFVSFGWRKKATHHKIPNIMALINRFNILNGWTIYNVVDHPYINIRVHKLTWFINVCTHLVELNNFHSCMAILSALNTTCIARLRRTWDALTQDTLARHKQLQDLVDAAQRFRLLHQAYKNAIPPCMIYLGVMLLDFSFIEDENPTLVRGSEINFSKFRQMRKVIADYESSRSTPYSFVEIPRVKVLLNEMKAPLNIDQLLERSKEIEL